jgi:hypothetical protein
VGLKKESEVVVSIDLLLLLIALLPLMPVGRFRWQGKTARRRERQFTELPVPH